MRSTDLSPLLKRQLETNTYFSPFHRLMYVATPKVACTSLKWWFAELLGVQDAIERSNISLESDPALVIHDVFSQVAPEYTGANEAGVIEALTSSDYFRFCVVRNPFTRVFSAWQSKWLLREPLQADAYSGADDEYVTESAEEIRAAFESFLRILSTVDDPSHHDPHVAPQWALLAPQQVSYRVLGKIEDPSALLQALTTYLGPGFRSPLAGQRANESLLPYSATWVSEEAANLIRSIYARDFELFGYSTAVPAGAGAMSVDALALALRSIKLLRGRSKRISELVARLSSATPAHHGGAAVQSTMQLYWSISQNGVDSLYSERSSVYVAYPVVGERKTIRLKLPAIQEPVIRFRLDPANQPIAIVLHDLKLESADGTLLWRWNGGQDDFRHVFGLALRSHSEGVMAVSLTNDPQCELAMPEEVLAQLCHGSVLTVEMTCMALHEGCAEVIRVDEKMIANLQAAIASTSTFGATGTTGDAQSREPNLSKKLENVAALLKSSLARRDQAIAEQSMQIRAMRDELLRAEAQLDLLKDVMLGGREEDRL